ncbi:amidohydrolase [Acidisoma cellulosilytica]|uniref:Amidohydrolase n=1 Tax=Acidisoma cellulosilyticum TaxID=2802395 RepID=A0A963Z4L4_9PROT|nr:amidohydrolase [Acidisoma cellulosilyticum]MCB8882775.1 amidohydrolase [Acidisoma cellulosilyticum]
MAVAPVSLALAGSHQAFAQTTETPVAANDAEADIVFHNGPVYTVDEKNLWARAVAVKAERIIYVGDDAGVQHFIGPKTRVIDLQGRMLLPGFVEGHIHPVLGSTVTRGIDLQFNSQAEVFAELRKNKDNLIGGVVRGFGWRYSAFPTTGPRKEDLDAIWPDTPVLLAAIDAHSAWANSKALSLAGITKDTPDPNPGFSYFQRDPVTHEPTGWLVEVPAILQVLAAAMPFTPEYIAASLDEWLPKASAAGITSLFDAGLQIVPNDVGFQYYTDLEKAGELPVRIVGSYYHVDPSIDPVPLISDLKTTFNTELVKASVLKLNMDGVDAARTAAMLEPYTDMPSVTGDSLLTPAMLNDIVLRADAKGLDIHVHSIGDRATRLTLSAMEAAIKTNPARDRRFTIAHCQGIDAADLPRFKQLGVIAEFSGQWAAPDPYWAEITTARWGKERANNTYRFGTLVRDGARITFGTDWPAASHYSTYRPLEAIEVGVTRCELGAVGQTPLPPQDERITLPQAIHANTLAAAHQIRLDHKVGSIEVGKDADLIVLDRNLFEAKPEQIHQAKVLLTLMGGQIRYEA